MPVNYLMEGTLFTQFQHPSQLEMRKVIIIKKVVITVADKSKALEIDSLQEPCMCLETHKAQPSIYSLNLCHLNEAAATSFFK